MRSILFLCAANVGRSQMAEGLARAKFPKDWHIRSAALWEDVGEKYEFHPHPQVTKIMWEYLQIDISEQRVELMSKFLHQSFDLVVNLTKRQVDYCPNWRCVYTHPISDPYQSQSMEASLVKTLESLEQLISQLKKQFKL